MYYITLDLEWNQAYAQKALAVQRQLSARLRGEVIQILFFYCRREVVLILNSMRKGVTFLLRLNVMNLFMIKNL